MIGLCYIRTAPAVDENGIQDYSHTDTPLVFDGFNGDGTIAVHYPKGSFDASCLGTKTRVIPKYFADGNWTLVTNVENGVKTALNKWHRKMIQRIRPVDEFDRSFCDKPVKLITATRYHVVVQGQYRRKIILDYRFAKPEDWRLA